MTPDQAQALARRVVNTWRLTPPLTEWVETLTTYDEHHATATFTDLKTKVDGGLSIKAFHTHYQARLTGLLDRARNRPTRGRVTARPECPLCSGSGYVDGDPLYQTVNGERHTYTTVDYCPCTQPRTPTPPPTDEPQGRLL